VLLVGKTLHGRRKYCRRFLSEVRNEHSFYSGGISGYEDRAYGDIGMLNRFGKLVHTRKTESAFVLLHLGN
jgi:hypothetical protein